MENKNNWLVIGATIFGAVLGALITIVGAPYFQELILGPSEGVFRVDVRSIRASSVEQPLRNQITKYPVFIQIEHIEGPSVKDVSITLRSENKLDSLITEREDDIKTSSFLDDSTTLRITIPELRKGSINHYQINSLGDPRYDEPSIQMSEGRLVTKIPELAYSKEWYESAIFIILVIVILIAAGIGGFFYFASNLYGKELTESLLDKNFIFISIIAVTISILPFFGSIAIFIPLVLIAYLAKRLSKIEEKID